MRSITFLVTVGLLAFSVLLHAQESLQFEHVEITPRGRESRVTSVAQDSIGFLWIGTDNGLFRYDGVEFIHYQNQPNESNSISDNYITLLRASAGSKLWIGNNSNSVDMLDLSTGLFEHFLHPEQEDISVNVSQLAGVLIDDDGLPIVLTIGGQLALYDGRNKAFAPLSGDVFQPLRKITNQIIPSLESRDNTFLLCSNDGAIAKIDRSNFNITKSSIGEEESSITRSWGESWSYLSASGLNFLYVFGHGLFLYDTKTESFNPVATEFEFGNITSAITDKKGDIWFATSSIGILKYNSAKQTFTNYNQANSKLLHDSVHSIIFDNSGNLWAGTEQGVCKFSKYKLKFSDANYLNESPADQPLSVLAICEGNTNELFIATDNLGIYRAEINGSKRLTPLYSLALTQPSNVKIMDLLLKSNELLLATIEAGLLKIDLSSERQTVLSEQIQFADIYETKNGDVLLGTFLFGLGTLSDTQEADYWVPDELGGKPVGSLDVTCITEDSKGNLWLGTDGFGVVRIVPAGDIYESYTHNSSDLNSIPSDKINYIFADSADRIWICTANGLTVFSLESNSFQLLSSADGLASNFISAVVEDDEGDFWISTNAGFSRLRYQTTDIQNYSYDDGLKSTQFNPKACYKDDNGTIYFGSQDGLLAFHPDQLAYNARKPNIILTKVIKQGMEMEFDAPVYKQNQIALNYDESYFDLEFAALDYSNAPKNRYMYMLEGFDDTWVNAGNRNSAHYTKVPPGDYTFLIKGSNNDGLFSEVARALEIRIIPPFWMRWDFRIGMALIIIAAMYSAYYWKTSAIKNQRDKLQLEIAERMVAQGSLKSYQNRLRSLATRLTIAEELERQRISGVLHDRIGQALLMSKARLDQQALNMDESEGNKGLLEVRDMITNAIREIRTLTVEISPPSLSKFGLESAAESLVNRMGEKHKLKTIFIRGEKSPISKETAVLIYQAFRELVINVIKHANARSLKASINREGNNLVLSISDDGIGFDAEKFLSDHDDYDGFGLFSIQERIETIGGRMEIYSTLGKGSKTILTVPLPKENENE
jgi:signal transduction histidine kinase/ligand-binding sensor domain-containing protein